MHASPQPRRASLSLFQAWTRLPLALLPVLAACGGGSAIDEPRTAAPSSAAPTEQAQSLAVASPVVGTLTLVSATASGQARSGDLCAVSADGSVVLFANNSDSLVAGDTNNFATDLFAKNLRTGAITRATTTSNGATLSRNNATCLDLTPDGRFAAFMLMTTASAPFFEPVTVAEPAIFVKNLVTGALTRATPALTSLPTTEGFAFAGLSDDGQRLAFVALPTQTYFGGYDLRPNGPPRVVVSDLSNPAAVRYINLESQVRFVTQAGGPQGDVRLSPDGRQVAFSTAVNYPELGDTNGINDAFVLQIDTGALRRLNTDVSGNVLTGSGYGVQGFIGQGRRVVLHIPGNTGAGPGGLYAKNLDTGELRLVLATGGLRINSDTGLGLQLSLNDAGTRAVYVRRSDNNRYAPDVPVLRNLTTGQEINVATTAAGRVTNSNITTHALISADGTTAVFANSGTNLGAANRNFELRVYAKTVTVADAGRQ